MNQRSQTQPLRPTSRRAQLHAEKHRLSARAPHCVLRLGTQLSAALLLAGVASACNFAEFDEFRADAPIRTYDAPKGYRKTDYGNTMSAFRTGPDDARSVVAASAGRDSPVVFERMWNGNKITDSTFIRCKRPSDCKDGDGVGGALIAFPYWARDTQQEESGCIFAPGQPKAYVFCDSDTNANQSFELDVGDIHGDGNAAFFSGAGLPDKHPLGVVILGAYSVSNREAGRVSNGRVFVQPDFQPPGAPSDDDEVPVLEELKLSNPESGDLFADEDSPGDLGAAIAVSALANGELVLAVAQPSQQRVIVALQPESSDAPTTRACINTPDPGVKGFGKRLALGDINDDGMPEIFVGTEAANSAERVWMYRGAALPEEEAGVCPEWGAEPIEVTCRGDARGVRCDDSGFGAALAVGDVDGDGFNDLLVGAPNAKVGSAAEAGAVWLIPGGKDSPRDGGLDFDRITSLYANKKARAHLGSSVAALRTRDRDEPVAGAPGEQRVYTFMCSSLEDDQKGRDLCLPK
jgi:hypothetical protein